MAYNRALTLFLVALLLFAAANPLAHGAIIPTLVNGVSLTGQLCCTSTGNCPGQGVGGVAVTLNCTILGVTTTVGRTTTNATGSFNITVPALTGLILGLPILPCVAAVQLPLAGVVCPILSTTTGILAGAVQSVGTVVTGLLGLVQNATVSGFVHLTA